MIVTFAIDTDALPIPAGSSHDRTVAHKRLLELWAAHGVLAHEGARLADSKLITLVDGLPQSLRTLWQHALKHNRHAPLPTGKCLFPSASTTTDLIPWSGTVDVACLEETRAFCLGLPQDSECIRAADCNIELCRLETIDRTESFRAARDLAVSDIERDTPVSEVWRERLSTPLKYCKTSVVVVDRYGIEHHLTRYDGYSGLRKLITELIASGRRRSVSLYSSLPPGVSDAAARSALEPLVRSLRSVNVDDPRIYIADRQAFGRVAHHRYIRFDNVVCDLDVGLEALAGDKVNRACPFKMKQRSATTDDIENALRGISDLMRFA